MREDRQPARSAGGLLLGAAALLAWSACGHDPYTVGPVCQPGEQVPCYSGPPGTEGEGVCQPGYRECDADAEGFGPCTNEVLPTPELCQPGEAKQVDEDCDGQINEEGEGCECAPGEEEPCYDGPAGTEEVGMCAAGVRTCELGAWTACTGQVVPMQEDCTNLLDEDCDGRACAANVWSLLAGDAADQHVAAIAVDADRRLFVAGSFEGTLDLGGAPMERDDGTDAFVAAFAPDGEPLWARAFSTPGDDEATAVAVTPDGGVVIAGTFAELLKIDQAALVNEGGLDAFAVKLDAGTGKLVWARRLGRDGDQRPASIAVTEGGDTIVAGAFDGYLACAATICSLDPAAIGTHGAADVFVWKLDAAGQQTGLAGFGGPENDRAHAVTADDAGNAIVAGEFRATMQVGETTLAAGSTLLPDAFLLTLAAADLAPISAVGLGDDATQIATSVAWADGAVFLAGLSFGVIDWGFATTAGSTDMGQIFVARLAADGQGSWARGYPAQLLRAPQIAVAPDGRVALAASFGGTIDFGPGPLVAGPGTAAVLAQLLPGGAGLWAKVFGAGANDEARAVAVAPDGEIAFGGDARSAIDFGKGQLFHAGGSDVALARFWP